MTYVYHYRIIQNLVAALESLCVLPLYPYPLLPPIPLTTNNPIIFLLLPLFCLALSLKQKNKKQKNKLQIPRLLTYGIVTTSLYSHLFL